MSWPTATRFICLILFAVGPLTQVSRAQANLLKSGPMVGYGQMSEVMLWVQTTEPASVQYRYWDEESAREKFLSASAMTSEEGANVAKIRIINLKPGRTFQYELILNGQAVTRPYRLRFKTQPLWQWRADPPDFTVAIGSCAYVNEPEWDRPGRPYGSNYEIFQTIARLEPDLMVWLGDNTYYREVDWHSVSGLQHRWTHTRALPDLQPLLGSAHHYAVWDDHDYGPNDSDRSYRLRAESLENHKLFWANQTYGTAETPGVFGRFEWGDVEFFLLDNRYYRSPNNAPADGKSMLGGEQLHWLTDALRSSEATFKVIAGGNQMLNPNPGNKEAFVHFPDEYRRLLTVIKEERISGVIFISGDRHFAELIRLDDPHAYPLYDFTSSSLTAGLSAPQGSEIANPHRVEGTLVTDAHNFGLLRFSGRRDDRKVALECWDYTGRQRWKREIKASELRRSE